MAVLFRAGFSGRGKVFRSRESVGACVVGQARSFALRLQPDLDQAEVRLK